MYCPIVFTVLLPMSSVLSFVTLRYSAPPTGVFAVIDLYGQCGQVSITSGSGVLPNDNNLINRAVTEHTNFMSPITSGRYLSLSSNSKR